MAELLNEFNTSTNTSSEVGENISINEAKKLIKTIQAYPNQTTKLKELLAKLENAYNKVNNEKADYKTVVLNATSTELEEIKKEIVYIEKDSLEKDKYFVFKEKAKIYNIKENIDNLISNLKGDKLNHFNKLFAEGNDSDAYLLLFINNNIDFKLCLNGLNKINNINKDNKEWLIFTVSHKFLSEIGKLEGKDLLNYMKEISNSDYYQYRNIIGASSKDFQKNFVENINGIPENIKISLGTEFLSLQPHILENIVKKFGNDKINIFTKGEDFSKFYKEILTAPDLIIHIKEEVFGMKGDLNSEILSNIEKFVLILDNIGGIHINDNKISNNYLSNGNVTEKFNSLMKLKIDSINKIKGLKEAGISKIKEILNSSSDFNIKIKSILDIDEVKELVKDKPDKAKYILDLIFNSLGKQKSEQIDAINSILDKKENEKLKEKFNELGYITINLATGKKIFDTDKLIYEIYKDEKEELKQKGKRNKKQILEDKLKSFGLETNEITKLSPLLLDLWKTEDNLQKVNEIKKDPEKFKNFSDFVNSTISEIKEKDEKEKIEKENKANNNSNLQIGMQITSEGQKYFIENKNERIELSYKEAQHIGHSQEKIKAIFEFKTSLDDLGLGFLWKDREILFQNIKNSKGDNAINILDDNIIGEQEFKNILNYIALKIDLPEKENLTDLKNDFRKIKNSRMFKGKYYGDDENKVFIKFFQEKGLFYNETSNLKLEKNKD